MRNSSEIIDALNQIEMRFPVQSWRAGDIDLWPSYRIRLYGLAIDRALLSEAPSISRAMRWKGLASRGARALLQVPLARLADAGQNASVRPGTSALIFSDGVSFTRLDELWFDRIMDPVILALERRGQRTLKLTPMSNVHLPRSVPSLFIQPSLDRIKLLATLGSAIELTIPAFPEVNRLARELFGSLVPGLDWVSLQARRLDRLAGLFGKTIARTGVHHVFVNTYYSLEGMAMIQAAKRAGVRSIDVQHGMQGPQHVAYSRWIDVPANGYSTLPDEFWVWSDADSDVINSWQPTPAPHRPQVAGNPWVEIWLADKDPQVVRALAAARALRRDTATPHVLVCLSWGIDQEEDMKIVRAAKLSGNSAVWWWRLHPVQAHRHREFAAILAREGLDDRHVLAATELPLPALVRSADVMVAHSSTTIQEAADLGIASIVTSDYGAELHATLIKSGRAIHATSDAAIAKAVHAVQAAQIGHIAVTPGTQALEALVDQVISAQEQVRRGGAAVG